MNGRFQVFIEYKILKDFKAIQLLVIIIFFNQDQRNPKSKNTMEFFSTQTHLIIVSYNSN